MVPGKDNTLLVEFDFIVDLDLAMYRYVKINFYYSPIVNKKLLDFKNETAIKAALLARYHINPLEILIPGMKTDKMYYQLMDDPNLFSNLVMLATTYDTFGLMITFLREASSVSIDVICRNELESKIITELNHDLSTVIFPNKAEVNLDLYTALYLKYFVNATQYRKLNGKHIYIPMAKYNMEDDQDAIDLKLLNLYSKTNEIHCIDLYRDCQYRVKREENNDADLL